MIEPNTAEVTVAGEKFTVLWDSDNLSMRFPVGTIHQLEIGIATPIHMGDKICHVTQTYTRSGMPFDEVNVTNPLITDH